MNLPWLIHDRKSKWIYFFLGGAATLILYQCTNRYFLWTPRLLEFGPVDSVMPFWPWTVWVYFTEYIFFIAAYFGLQRNDLVTKYFYAYNSILVVSVVVFMLYPVTFPRESYPVLGSDISDHAMRFLRTYMDSPANCLPSLHVSSCYISSLCFWHESRKKAVALSLWSTCVAGATMTTKQHYFVDVWTAIILTMFFYWVFFYRINLVKGSGNAAAARL